MTTLVRIGGPRVGVSFAAGFWFETADMGKTPPCDFATGDCCCGPCAGMFGDGGEVVLPS